MQYRSIISGLRYLTHTRPDIEFVVSYLSRFMENPCEDHTAAVKRVLRYVAETIGHGIVYSKRSKGRRLELIGFSDSNMARDVDGRKSTTVATTCCQGIWLGWLLQELTGEKLYTPVLKVDNKSTIALAKNPVLHD
ncbi:uncharacterized mitochondrial protein AtMg00240-like [Setaria viridis]|uniref:uncharacterized mitochondrial protein AtMg00240-like n=1 Tax=Setaria viridis TaxID=4556 RepID=UPI00149370F3|nr:uncharacterized mitochondrial protein AtMg00240-like [Setaria viridis]